MDAEVEISNMRNRHVARLFSSLDGIKIAPVVESAIKREFTFFGNDVADLMCDKRNTSNEEIQGS